MKAFTGTLIALIMIAIIGSCTYYGPDIKKYWGVRYGQVDREIFEQNLSYVRGTIENLQKLKMEYKLAESQGHRMAIREMILTESASFTGKLPNKLETFINSLEN